RQSSAPLTAPQCQERAVCKLSRMKKATSQIATTNSSRTLHSRSLRSRSVSSGLQVLCLGRAAIRFPCRRHRTSVGYVCDIRKWESINVAPYCELRSFECEECSKQTDLIVLRE